MYQFSYAEIQADSVADARDRERQLLDRSIELLQTAQKAGPDTREAIEAIHYTTRIWTSFISDLGRSDNELPKELRANLISIGLWVLRECEAVRQGNSRNFEGISDISQIIRDGLQ